MEDVESESDGASLSRQITNTILISSRRHNSISIEAKTGIHLATLL